MSKNVPVPHSIHAVWVTDREESPAQSLALRDAGIHVVVLPKCGEARRFLREHHELHVVLTDVTLPDGNWSTVFHASVHSGVNVPVFVCAPAHSQRLLEEVVQRGCHFLLAAKGLGSEAVRLIAQAVDGRAARASAGAALA